MAIQSFSPAQLQNLSLPEPESRSKYPWRTTLVGGAFFVPRNMYSREDYKLNTPPTLRRQGWKFKCRSVTIEGTVGLLVTRIT